MGFILINLAVDIFIALVKLFFAVQKVTQSPESNSKYQDAAVMAGPFSWDTV